MAYKVIAKVNGKKVYEYSMIWGSLKEAEFYKRLLVQTNSEKKVKYHIVKF